MLGVASECLQLFSPPLASASSEEDSDSESRETSSSESQSASPDESSLTVSREMSSLENASNSLEASTDSQGESHEGAHEATSSEYDGSPPLSSLPEVCVKILSNPIVSDVQSRRLCYSQSATSCIQSALSSVNDHAHQPTRTC